MGRVVDGNMKEMQDFSDVINIHQRTKLIPIFFNFKSKHSMTLVIPNHTPKPSLSQGAKQKVMMSQLGLKKLNSHFRRL